MHERVAEALYNHWRSSDRELVVEWADAPDNLRGVFLRQAAVAVEASAGS